MRISVEYESTAAPFLDRAVRGFSDRRQLNKFIAGREEQLTRGYLAGIATKRHKTARKLGANPTGHLSRAAESVTSDSDKEGATITIASPGISRAFKDLVIEPRKANGFLTIPIHKDSYGARAREFDDLFIIKAKKQRGEDGKARQALLLARVVSGEQIEALYVLVKRANIPQDRSLLPSDQAFIAAAELGARDFIKHLDEDA